MNIRHFISRSEAPSRTAVTKDGGMPQRSANVGNKEERCSFQQGSAGGGVPGQSEHQIASPTDYLCISRG